MSYNSPVSYAADVGTYRAGVLSNPGTNADFIRYIPNDAGTTPWIEGVNSAANFVGPRRNQTMTMGWNLGVGGGRDVTGALNGALGISMEQYYETAGGDKVMEFHNLYVSPADVQTRFLSFMGNLESPYETGLYIYSTQMNIGSGKDANDAPSLLIRETSTQLQAPDGYGRLLLQDAATLSLSNGNVGDNALGYVSVASDGFINLDTKLTGRLNATGTRVLEWDQTSIRLYSPDGTSALINVSDGAGPILYAGGVAKLQVGTTNVHAAVPFTNHIQGIGTGVADASIGLQMYNNTAAADGAQQYSPSLMLRGMGWKSDATAGTQANGWYMQARPVQGTSVSSVNLSFGSSINEGAPTEKLLLTSGGLVQIPNGSFFTSSFGASSTAPNGTVKLGSIVNRTDFLTVDPATTGSVPWGMGFASYDNDGNPNKNNVFGFGWNYTSQGPADPAKGSFTWTVESEYGPTGGAQMEHYMGFSNGLGGGGRFFSVNAALANPLSVDIGIVGTRVALGYAAADLTINDANRIVVVASATSVSSSAAGGFFGTLSLTDTTVDLSADNGSDLARLNLVSGAVDLTATAGGMGKDGGTRSFRWTATEGVVSGPNGVMYLQANNTDVRLVGAGGNVGVVTTGNETTLNAAGSVFVQRAGTRIWRFGEEGAGWKLFGANEDAWLALAGGANVGLFDGTGVTRAGLMVADAQGILFQYAGATQMRANNLGIYPETDNNRLCGADGQRWVAVWGVKGAFSYLSNQDGASNYFIPTGSGNYTLVADTLAQTLTNKKLGSDLPFTAAARSIYIEDSAAGAALTVRPGNATSIGVQGGHAFYRSGDGGPTDGASAAGAAGDLMVLGGDAGSNGGDEADGSHGGNVFIGGGRGNNALHQHGGILIGTEDVYNGKTVYADEIRMGHKPEYGTINLGHIRHLGYFADSTSIHPLDDYTIRFEIKAGPHIIEGDHSLPDGGAGTPLLFRGGQGGDALVSPAAIGGALTLTGGEGGDGTAALAAGTGADLNLYGGAAGAANGGAGANGGHLVADAGVASGAGTNGQVFIGSMYSLGTNIGRAGINTTIVGLNNPVFTDVNGNQTMKVADATVVNATGKVLAIKSGKGNGNGNGGDLWLIGADRGASASYGGSVIIDGGLGSSDANGGVILIGTDNGGPAGRTASVKIGNPTSTFSIYGVTAVVQPSTTGETAGFTAGSGTPVNDDSTFTGGVGSKAYNLNDLVKHLKNLGGLAAS